MAARLYLAIAFAVAIALGAGRSASADDLAVCAGIDDASARLACYDKLAGRQAPPGVGKWRLDHRRSPLSGGDMVSLTLHADQADPTALPPWLQPQLIITCDNGENQVVIVPQTLISASYNNVDVLLRVDGGDQIRENWQLSGDGQRAYRPDPVPWIKGLFGATQLEFGIRPFLGKPLDFTFDVEGLATAIQPLVTACHW